MMMISNRRSRAPLRGLAALAVVALLVCAAALWREPLSELLWRALAPVMAARMGGISVPLQSAALADRDALYQETLDLKERLGRSGVAPSRVLSGVLLRPPATPYDTLVIDAGFGEGVREGDMVAAAGTALVGTVSQVYEDSARVQLFSAPGTVHEGLLRPGQAGVPLKVEGQGGGSMSAQVPAGTVAAAGDTVLLPGIAGGVTAKVSHVSFKEGESFITVYMRLPADIFGLRYVEVWTSRQ